MSALFAHFIELLIDIYAILLIIGRGPTLANTFARLAFIGGAKLCWSFVRLILSAVSLLASSFLRFLFTKSQK